MSGRSATPTSERTNAGQRVRAGLLKRWLIDQWMVHLTLIVMGAMFVLPFLWMVGMSLKTDDEATKTDLFPSVPTFRTASPYVLPPEAVQRPTGSDVAKWERLLPRLTQQAAAAVEGAVLPPGTRLEDQEALRRAATAEVVRQRVARMDSRLWTADRSDEQALQAFSAGLTAADVAPVVADRLARLELTGVQVRSLTGHIVPVSKPGRVDGWRLVSGNATLVPTPDATLVVQYQFVDSSSQPVVLKYDFDAGVSPDELHRMIVSFVGDASWHRIDADLELGSRRYRSEQSTYVALLRGTSLLMQPPTFQDDTLEPRTWVPMRPIGLAATPDADLRGWETRASLTLTLRPSSTLQAVYGKLERNYARAFRSVPFWTYLLNSVELVVLQVAGALFSSAFVGYAFARLNWPGRSLAMGLLLATMMLPAQVTMIPSFMIWRSLGWYNTLNPLWVVAWLGNAFFIFLMVQHMRTIPRELDEAAKIDGMNTFQTWWYVIVPQVKPTLASIAIMTFMGAWNDFMGPLVMLRDQTKFPLSLGLFSMRLDSLDDWSLIMAGNLLMTLPVILIFFLFQRYFIEGVTVTGMKG